MNDQERPDLYHGPLSRAAYWPQRGPHSWVQWKGSEVCMDVHCACGVHGHVDASFVYALKCLACGRVYFVNPYVELVEFTQEEAAHVERGVDFCEPIEFGPG